MITQHSIGRVASRRRMAPVLTVLVAAVVAGCRGGADEASAADAAPAGGSVTLWTDSTELFMEHPALIVGEPDKFAVHLTDLTDFAPLRSGKITLRFAPVGGGAPVVVTQDAPRSPGIYGPAPEFSKPGMYDLTLIVESPQARDSITVRALRVYASATEAPKEQGGAESGISFLKEQQWKTAGFQTAFATRGTVMESFDASGVLEPAAGRFARIAAPIDGLVDASGVAQSPWPGQRVERGQVLALLTPSLGEGGSVFAEQRARLREAEDEYDRAKRLYAAEAIPERRLRAAEIRLTAAREAIAGLGGAATKDGQLALRAPIGGVVAGRSIAPGSRVEAGTPLFTVVDSRVVWLRVNVPAALAPRISLSSGATFRPEGALQEYRVGRTVSVGSMIDSLSRTVPVIYEMPNENGAITIGANARVAVRTGQHIEGVVIPASSVLDEDGRPIAYVQVEGEAFEKRELALGGTDGEWALVRSGIEEGERVVTNAAYQVRLASLSTAVPAHGHEH